MALLDWVIIAAYFILTAGIGLAYTKKASKNVSEFFVSGRSLPWWLAGTSMVATTFAADTPLAVTGMVAANGVAGNWRCQRRGKKKKVRVAPHAPLPPKNIWATEVGGE